MTKIMQEFSAKKKEKLNMRHDLWDVLSVWWIVIAVDLFVTYLFIKLANRS